MQRVLVRPHRKGGPLWGSLKSDYSPFYEEAAETFTDDVCRMSTADFETRGASFTDAMRKGLIYLQHRVWTSFVRSHDKLRLGRSLGRDVTARWRVSVTGGGEDSLDVLGSGYGKYACVSSSLPDTHRIRWAQDLLAIIPLC